eukprot:242025-Rhodomonas_salina.1
MQCAVLCWVWSYAGEQSFFWDAGTELAYGAMRCVVLRWRRVLCTDLRYGPTQASSLSLAMTWSSSATIGWSA